MTEIQQFVSVAESLAKKAGDLCLELQGHLGDIKYKSAKDVVTIADVSSEKLIVDGLREAFPTHSIRTEEAGVIEGADPRYCWIIDPVDGTVNFSRGIPFWGISIALHFEGKPLVAVVNLPRLGELFTAMKDGGAFMNGKRQICVISWSYCRHRYAVGSGSYWPIASFQTRTPNDTIIKIIVAFYEVVSTSF